MTEVVIELVSIISANFHVSCTLSDILGQFLFFNCSLNYVHSFCQLFLGFISILRVSFVFVNYKFLNERNNRMILCHLEIIYEKLLICYLSHKRFVFIRWRVINSFSAIMISFLIFHNSSELMKWDNILLDEFVICSFYRKSFEFMRWFLFLKSLKH